MNIQRALDDELKRDALKTQTKRDEKKKDR